MPKICAALAGLVGAVSGMLHLPIARREDDSHGSQLSKRAVGSNDFEIPFSFSGGGFYYTNITVGTPPQELTFLLNDGVSDSYVISFCNRASTDANACVGGLFSPSASTTYASLEGLEFNISLTDGTTTSGPFGTDIIGIGDVEVSNFQFGVVNDPTTEGRAINTLGLGYSARESSAVFGNYSYPNLLDVLQQSGVIDSRLYSLFLGSQANPGSGTILFGAMDISKYTGEIATINALPTAYDNPNITSFSVAITEAFVHTSANDSTIFSGGRADINAYNDPDNAVPVYLTTSSSVWYMPTQFYNDHIVWLFPNVTSGGYIPCSDIDPSDYISLTFADQITIKFSMSELIEPVFNATTKQPLVTNDETWCLLPIYDGGEQGPWYLGTAFLRSMYTIWDLDNAQVSIAQAVLNSTEEPNVVTIGSGPSGIASALPTLPADYTVSPNSYFIPPMVTNTSISYRTTAAATPVGTVTGLDAIPLNARISTTYASTTTRTSPPTATVTSNDESGGGGTNTGAIAGGVVGGVAGLALIAGAIAFFVSRKRKAKKPTQEMQSETTLPQQWRS